MDITNSTGIDTEYRVTSPVARAARPEWKRLAPNDYAIVNPGEGGPWTIELRVRGNGSIAEVVDSPRASVVLEEAAGKYRVQSSVASFDAFLMASTQEELEEKLDRALRDHGLSIWSRAGKPELGFPVRSQLEKAIHEARNVVALIGPESRMTERQSLERAIVLEAIWRDPGKRLIPLLLGNPELPSFVRAASNWTRRVVAIRIEDARRDWGRAISDLVQILKGEADPREKGELIDTLEEDRRLFHERLDYIGEVVAEWKRRETRGKKESTQS